jgi:predicted ArsR family transcriptional regulator
MHSLNYLHEFMDNFKKLILFNTIAKYTKKNPDGLTHSDIIEIDPNIPRTRISRGMMKLTKEGYLQEKEIKNEIGRPTKYYSLTEKGKKFHQNLKTNILDLYATVQERLTDDLSEFDFQNLPKGRFGRIDHIISCEGDSIDDKIEKLTEIKEDLEEQLERVNLAINELKNTS